MVRSDRWKYTCAVDDPVEQLFDMDADPGETVNLASDAQCAEVLQRHRHMLVQWEAGHELAPDCAQFTKIILNQEEPV
jgi:arylsulfatase A-like enzyme